MSTWLVLAVLGLCLLSPQAMARPLDRGEHLLLAVVVLLACFFWRKADGRPR